MLIERLLPFIIALIAPLSGFIIWAVDRRYKKGLSVNQSTNHTMETITESAVSLVEVVDIVIEPLKEEVQELKKEVKQLKGDYSVLEKLFKDLVEYAKVLRTQIVELGHEPTPFPSSLNHLED